MLVINCQSAFKGRAVTAFRIAHTNGSPGSQMAASIIRQRGPWIALAVVIVTVLYASVSLAPSALADSVANFRNSVVAAHSGTSCAQLRYNSVVEQVAEIINRSTDDYMNHTATQVPIKDPLPGLEDLGYGGKKGTLLLGAAKNEADAIKGALLEGYAAIPECSYTDFGVSVRRNEPTGYILASLVLAGP
jgi:hypothetical protein